MISNITKSCNGGTGQGFAKIEFMSVAKTQSSTCVNNTRGWQIARKPLFILPGVPQHISQRSCICYSCFYALYERLRYLSDLYDAANENHVAVHAYMLMTNNVHLLATPVRCMESRT